jgi:hypothetical protein
MRGNNPEDLFKWFVFVTSNYDGCLKKKKKKRNRTTKLAGSEYQNSNASQCFQSQRYQVPSSIPFRSVCAVSFADRLPFCWQCRHVPVRLDRLEFPSLTYPLPSRSSSASRRSACYFVNLDQQFPVVDRVAPRIQQAHEAVPAAQAVEPDARPREELPILDFEPWRAAPLAKEKKQRKKDGAGREGETRKGGGELGSCIVSQVSTRVEGICK